MWSTIRRDLALEQHILHRHHHGAYRDAVTAATMHHLSRPGVSCRNACTSAHRPSLARATIISHANSSESPRTSRTGEKMGPTSQAKQLSSLPGPGLGRSKASLCRVSRCERAGNHEGTGGSSDSDAKMLVIRNNRGTGNLHIMIMSRGNPSKTDSSKIRVRPTRISPRPRQTTRTGTWAPSQ